MYSPCSLQKINLLSKYTSPYFNLFSLFFLIIPLRIGTSIEGNGTSLILVLVFGIVTLFSYILLLSLVNSPVHTNFTDLFILINLLSKSISFSCSAIASPSRIPHIKPSNIIPSHLSPCRAFIRSCCSFSVI
jgi:hypothetical protein